MNMHLPTILLVATLAAVVSGAAEENKSGTARLVWSGSMRTDHKAVSPDGRFLAYVDWDTGDIGIYELATGQKRRLTHKGSWDDSPEYGYRCIWSPDSRRIAYTWCIHEPNRNTELRVIGIDGSDPKILYTAKMTDWILPQDWSPDGRRILAKREGEWLPDRRGREGEIVEISVTDGSYRRLQAPADLGRNRLMSASPDGQTILYTALREVDGRMQQCVSIMPSAPNSDSRSFDNFVKGVSLGWAPDGASILFNTWEREDDGSRRYVIWRMPVVKGRLQGTPELVRRISGGFRSLGVGESGDFYYATWTQPATQPGGSFEASLNSKTGGVTSEPSELIGGLGEAACAYSPDGRHLALLHSQDRAYALSIRDLSNGNERDVRIEASFVPLVGDTAGPRWSPNNRSILVLGRDHDETELKVFVIDTSTDEVEVVPSSKPDHTLLACELSANGRSIYCLRRNKATGHREIVLHDPETGVEREIYRSPGNHDLPANLRLSPDGKQLVLRSVRPTSVKLLPVEGGEPQEITGFGEVATYQAPIAWAADGRSILFPGKQAGTERLILHRLLLEGGAVEPVGVPMDRYHSISAHPDSRRLLISARETNTKWEVWAVTTLSHPRELPGGGRDPGEAIAKETQEPNVIHEHGAITVRRVCPADIDYRAVSPDGRYLAGTDWDTGDLAIYEVAAGQRRRLTHKEGSWDDSTAWAYSAIWSPDSRRIAYSWHGNRYRTELRIIGLNETEPVTLHTNVATADFWETSDYWGKDWLVPHDWSPDGRHILASASPDGQNTMMLISVADGARRILETAGDSLSLHPSARLAFSPDGKHVLYTGRQKVNEKWQYHLSMAPVTGDSGATTTRAFGTGKALAWVPHAKSILFLRSEEGGSAAIWRIGLANGQPEGRPERLTTVSNEEKFWPLGPTDAGTFYYHLGVGGTGVDVYRAALDNETGRVLSEPEKLVEGLRGHGSTSACALSPDEQRLAYMHLSNPQERRGYVLGIRELSSGVERTFPIQLWVLRGSTLSWSPDGGRLLFVGQSMPEPGTAYRAGAAMKIFTIDVQTGQLDAILKSEPGKELHWAPPQWCGDGRSIIYMFNRRVVICDLESGHERELYHWSSGDPRPQTMALSPDGRQLALRCVRPTSLKILALKEGKPRDVAGFEAVAIAEAPIAWTRDGKYILFPGEPDDEGKCELYRVSIASGAAEAIGMRMPQYFSISVHPNGRSFIALGHSGAAKSEIWALDNLAETSSR